MSPSIIKYEACRHTYNILTDMDRVVDQETEHTTESFVEFETFDGVTVATRAAAEWRFSENDYS